MPEEKVTREVETDPMYHLKQYAPYALCFLSSFGSYFSNGGHIPTTPEGGIVFAGNILTWFWMAVMLQRGGDSVAK